jgi:hypothetical protein
LVQGPPTYRKAFCAEVRVFVQVEVFVQSPLDARIEVPAGSLISPLQARTSATVAVPSPTRPLKASSNDGGFSDQHLEVCAAPAISSETRNHSPVWFAVRVLNPSSNLGQFQFSTFLGQQGAESQGRVCRLESFPARVCRFVAARYQRSAISRWSAAGVNRCKLSEASSRGMPPKANEGVRLEEFRADSY